MGTLEGRRALITGAGGALGRATSVRFAREGASVAVVDISEAAADETVRAVTAAGGVATSVVADVRSDDDARRAVEQAAAAMGGIDILFNNAGLALGRVPFWESSEEDERTVIETNVNGLLRMTRLCLPHLRDGGHIVNMGSVAGRQAYPNGASYVAAKFAVRGFTYALREDLLGRPIRLTTVDAGLVETEFSLVRFKGDAETAKSVYAGLDPVTPDEVADCVLFALTRPPHVNLDEIVIKALAQSSGARVVRRDG